jgi:putative membrane-bound dehydrogenase-like protein
MRLRFACLFLFVFYSSSSAADYIPRKQSKVPGPALSPTEALKHFQVPEGFRVELVAAEPELVNPVAMAFDDRGRIFVTESFEYPRREAGPGRDRIKILEDQDGDGRVDSVKIFAEGLNIPSGIAIGHGGVWVANAPDLLFLEDTDHDDRADRQTVVVTGFGRFDTHELPNALTWGPDGCLYGLNGVFNPSRVEQDGRVYDFTCAMFRIEPRTRKFDLFCQGTSNPWGIAFDNEGSAFVSACVIDHLWHLTESAYYHRQGGPYPPYTWKAESIVKHKHQLAAYCGIEWFDSPAYPAKYRQRLMMGNIHGNCINVDRVERHGATYRGFGEADFLSSDDVWFMPVAQKVGPDGCLYVLDWYDRYHCYQDANADPAGVDRGNGRLYRVVYQERPKVKVQDFGKLSNKTLIDALNDDNIYVRRQAELKLAERQAALVDSASQQELLSIIADEKSPLRHRLHALSAIVGSGLVSDDILARWMKSTEPLIRAWGVRTAGRQLSNSETIASAIDQATVDADPRVRIEAAIASGKVDPAKTSRRVLAVLKASQPDPILSRVVWQNLLPHAVKDQDEISKFYLQANLKEQGQLLEITPRLVGRWVDEISDDFTASGDSRGLSNILAIVKTTLASSELLAAEASEPLISKIEKGLHHSPAFRQQLAAWLGDVASLKRPSEKPAADQGKRWPATFELLSAIAGDEKAIKSIEAELLSKKAAPDRRSKLFRLVGQRPELNQQLYQEFVGAMKSNKDFPNVFHETILDRTLALGSESEIQAIAQNLSKLASGKQALIADRMCQRTPSATILLRAMAAKEVPIGLISPNQIELFAKNPSPEIQGLVKKLWGDITSSGTEERRQVASDMLNYLRGASGDPKRGLAVFDKVCGQCHKMHDRGVEVGPNITSNGRGNFEQLVTSVFNPSLVIGEAYKSLTVVTADGRVLSGLLVEKTDQQLVLKLQGDKIETIPADEIEMFKQNDKSLMPEGIEKQLPPQEIADLFALLSLEGPLGTTDNPKIMGTPAKLHSKP